ncbi:trehalose operon repressor [Streptococcus sp. DD12]|uniref:trehalose operon repressor n=1 Tax=Streptococcus sp. DD12 TaxID=1777880 RepID=UPI00079571C7|nr:trehalose operon repressor [Streptococcus sp. DD12]KXT75294.1 Trehalose operon transcriptional repressor [Streptococcus sp. DD12]
MKKYQFIYADLEKKILESEFPANSNLPTEKDLQTTYQVSRSTIRKALDLLQENGYIKKTQGQGSQVLNRTTIPLPVAQLTNYQQLVNQLNFSSQTRIIAFSKIITDQKLSQLTGFPEQTLLWKIIRQRIVNGKATILDTDYIKKDIVPALTKEEATKSLYSTIEQNHRIDFAKKEITIEKISENDKNYLDLGKDLQIVCIRSKAYLTDGRQFQFTESHHKLDKFQFTTIAKR